MTKIKCKKCGVWLFSAAGEIDIEIKCKKCKHLNRFQITIKQYAPSGLFTRHWLCRAASAIKNKNASSV